MKHSAVVFWLMLLTAVACGYAALTVYRMRAEQQRLPTESQYLKVDYKQLAKERNLRTNEFVLTDSNGMLFSSQMLRGKVWALSFFYSTCNKECLQLNKSLVQLQHEFPDPNLYFVSISCNPEIDTPDRLSEYIQPFAADRNRWIVLTGNYDYVSDNIALPAYMRYGRSDHNSDIVLIGKDGRIRDKFNLATADGIKAAGTQIRELLAEADPDPNTPPPPWHPRETKPAVASPAAEDE